LLEIPVTLDRPARYQAKQSLDWSRQRTPCL